jgi:hypothetical protein
MWRMAAVACVAACFALPAASRADAPGYTPVGPPATLSHILFAADGTMYGTAGSSYTTSRIPAVLWRSSDHGRTWQAAYRLPYGWHIEPMAVPTAEPTTVFASVTGPRQGSPGDVRRIDLRTGQVVSLSLGNYLGVDAAGTAYGFHQSSSPAYIIRCRRRADACDKVPFPAFTNPPSQNQVIVDPYAAGVLVAFDRSSASSTGTFVELSTDGGATWTQGAESSCCAAAMFAGPGPRTLYTFVSSSAGVQLAFSHDAGLSWFGTQAVPPGPLIVGSHPAVMAGGSVPVGPASLTSVDEGVLTTRSLTAPFSGSLLADPTDPNRIFLVGPDETRLSDDGGLTWRDIANPLFGMTSLDSSKGLAGTGSYLYAGAYNSIWFSHDGGATWGRTELPSGVTPGGIIVSRDDPRVAYAGTLRTVDGGITWQAIAPSGAGAVTWIAPGQPLHVFALGSSVAESVDGGATWIPSPQANWCIFQVNPDPTSPTGDRLRCNGWWIASDPLRPLPSPVPFAPGLTASPDLPGAVVLARSNRSATTDHQALLGDIRPDWSWSSLLAQTGGFGPTPAGADADNAWPATAGTTFTSWDTTTDTTWVRRGAGRWWRLRVSGSDVAVYALLDSTHAFVGTPGQYGDRGIVDLAHPSVGAPVLRGGASGLTCVVPWTLADAETTGYGWQRDGVTVAGATGVSYTPAARDAGHAIACTATARTDFGSATVTSEPQALPQLVAALTGTARVGALLRCAATAHIDWLRNGMAMKGRHARTYRVRTADSGHTLACQTHRSDGGLARSRAVSVRA